MNTKRLVVVTGATGQQGGAVARQLLSKGFAVRGVTRNPNSAAALALAAKGAELVQADFDNDASLEKAFAGAWGVFAVQNLTEGVEREEEQGKRTARIAREQGVQQFVYSSVASAHRNTGIPHFESKWHIEQAVRALNFPNHTIVRPVFFMENLLAPWSLQGDKLIYALQPTASLQMIAVEDIGKYAALAFEKPQELSRAELDIAGDSKTLVEAAAILSQSLGRTITFVQAPIEAVRKMSEDMAIMFEWFERVGYNSDFAALNRKYGISTMTLAEWAKATLSKKDAQS